MKRGYILSGVQVYKTGKIALKTWPVSFDTSYFGSIEMAYALQPSGKGSVPMIVMYGADQNWDPVTVLLSAATRVKVRSGMMKRAHSIDAQVRMFSTPRILMDSCAKAQDNGCPGLWLSTKGPIHGHPR